MMNVRMHSELYDSECEVNENKKAGFHVSPGLAFPQILWEREQSNADCVTMMHHSAMAYKATEKAGEKAATPAYAFR